MSSNLKRTRTASPRDFEKRRRRPHRLWWMRMRMCAGATLSCTRRERGEAEGLPAMTRARDAGSPVGCEWHGTRVGHRIGIGPIFVGDRGEMVG
jgi:hypothetical protein